MLPLGSGILAKAIYMIQILLINSNALNILVISKRIFSKEKAGIIHMLCDLVYVKKYWNIFYNSIGAKLKI